MRTHQILASAAFAFCALAANAQDSLQLYGVVDVGLLYANHIGASGTAPSGHVWKLESGNFASSRIGFRARESLGGGLTALFVLEGGFNADTGAFGTRFFSRASYVGLAGKWGEIQAGRQTTASYDFAFAFDPEAPSRFSTPVFDAAYAGRADNALKYLGKFGALNVSGQYSFGFDSMIANGAEQAAFRVGREAGAFANYDAGFGRFGVAVDRQYGTTVASQNDRTQRVNLGTTFTLGPAKVYVGHGRRESHVAGVSSSTRMSWVGADLKPLPALTVTPAYYINDPDGPQNRTRMAVVRAAYDLSRKTSLYTQLAHLRNDAGANRALVGPVANETKQTGLTLGMIHRF